MEPVSLNTPIGYISIEDVYVAYSEYYGDGTIYGRADLLTPEGEPVKGAGKNKLDLIHANTVISSNIMGAVNGDIIIVANESTPEVAAAPEEVAAAPEEVAAAPEELPTIQSPPLDGSYTVSLMLFGFTITREFSVKIDSNERKIYLN